MDTLVITHNKHAVTSSLQVAETFGKRHSDVMEAIRTKIQRAENSARYLKMFSLDSYTDSKGEKRELWYMNRDGFAFLAMGFTGKKADEFKLAYIDAFNQMEDTLKKTPVKKLDPVLQAQLAITKAKTAKANALYKIACKTDSDSSKQWLLAKAAESITGEMTIPVMKDKEYSATEVGKKLGISANKVGRIANSLGIKAEQPGQNEFGRWSNSKSQHSDKEVAQWLYTDAGLEAIKAKV